jgi:hypothetical protein
MTMTKINRAEMRKAWAALVLGRELAARIVATCWRSALRKSEKAQILDEAARMGLSRAEVTGGAE